MPRSFKLGAPDTTDAEYLERLKSRILVDANGCWLYQRFRQRGGYCDISYRGDNLRAHRVMFAIVNGPIPKGLNVLHKCDVRHCINPDHLFLGTISDNKQDEIKKGRNYERNRPACPHGHAYTESNTGIDGRGHRHCKACLLIRENDPVYREGRRQYRLKRAILKRESASRRPCD